MPKSLVILGVAAISLLAGVALWSLQQSRLPDTRLPDASAATVLPEPRAIPSFSLTDHEGNAFGNAQLQNRWSLLFFGFTRCPDICPNTLGLLQALNAALKQDGGNSPLQVVFVSVDPKHDQPAALKRYIEYFDPSFVAVTGPENELQKLTGTLYMPYSYVPTGKGDEYTVEHSGALVLLNPQGQAVAYFSPPLQVNPILSDLQGLLKS